MATLTSLRHVLSLILLSPLALAQTVTIDDDIPLKGHNCIKYCLDDRVYTDVGDALACGAPYENDCYCATATASASVASAFINKCASESCSAGDLTQDISTMRGIYASYCIGAGFTQPIVSEWITTADEPEDEADATSTAEPSETEDSGPAETTTDVTPTTEDSDSAETTTRVTVVTQTTEPEGGATGSRGELFLLGAIAVPAMVLQLL